MRAILMLIVLLSLQAHAGGEEFPITGTFSSLHCIEEPGDILGMEVQIVSGFESSSYKLFAIFQYAEGVASIPQVVPVTREDGEIEFEAQYLSGMKVKVTGKVHKDGLTGELSGPGFSSKYEIPRKESFWQFLGDRCAGH